MILEFKFQTTRDTIRVSAPIVEMSSEMRNLVGIHDATSQIVSIGDTAEEIKANAPEFWARNGSHIRFVRPFDLADTRAVADFEPLIAARLVQWFSNKAFAALKRQSFARILLGPWVDRVEYVLELEGFERLPAERRRQFYKHLTKLLVARRSISINGETIRGRQ